MKKRNLIIPIVCAIIAILYITEKRERQEFNQEIEAEIQQSHKQYLEKYHDRLFPEYEDYEPGKPLYRKDSITYEDLKEENAIYNAVESLMEE